MAPPIHEADLEKTVHHAHPYRRRTTRLEAADSFNADPSMDVAASGGKRLTALEKQCVSQTGVRREVWLFMSCDRKDQGIRRWATHYEAFSVLVVVLLVVKDILGSMKDIAEFFEEQPIFDYFEYASYAMFTLEYLLRLWSCTECRRYADKGWLFGRLVFARGVLPMVDMIVLGGFYVNVYLEFLYTNGSAHHMKGIQALRMIRLLRVAALLKVERKTNSFRSIFAVLVLKKNELSATLFTAAVLMIMSATFMYYIENGAQPGFDSVPAAMWWSVTALTTVGYGDLYPITVGGKLLASVVAFFGVGLFALPAGILGSGFVEVIQQQEAEEEETEVCELVDEEKRQLEAVIKGVDVLQSAVDRIQAGQQQVLRLLECLSPEAAAAASQATAERPPPQMPPLATAPPLGEAATVEMPVNTLMQREEVKGGDVCGNNGGGGVCDKGGVLAAAPRSLAVAAVGDSPATATADGNGGGGGDSPGILGADLAALRAGVERKLSERRVADAEAAVRSRGSIRGGGGSEARRWTGY